MKPPPPTVRAFIAGNSGSGKSTRAWDLYLAAFPRRILLDMTGEWAARADLQADTVPQLVAGIRQLCARGKWTISLALDPTELPQLVDWLIPVPQLHLSPVRTLGGVVVLVDEVDLLAPQGPAPEPVRTLYRRSRHVGLSVVSTTQRPANVSREVTAQSSHAVALYLSEPRDRDYMIDVMRLESPQVAAWLKWTRAHPHGGLWKDLQQNRVLWLPEKGPPSADGPGAAQLELAPPSLPGTPPVPARSSGDTPRAGRAAPKARGAASPAPGSQPTRPGPPTTPARE